MSSISSRRALGFALAATMLSPMALALPASAQTAPAQGRVFYIDFDEGSDEASGLSPAEAWKRAPGDPEATGRPAATGLRAGDRLLFRGGVRYRGTIRHTGSGTADNPIVYDGSSWGGTRAIIDGSDPLPPVRRCQSQADCLGAVHWRRLVRTTVPQGARVHDQIFGWDHAYFPGQWPQTRSLWDYDQEKAFAEIPRSQLNALKTGVIVHDIPDNVKEKGEPSFAFWTAANEIGYTYNMQFTPNGLNFEPRGWVYWSFQPFGNKPNKFALINVPDMVDKPGTFAMSAKEGVVIAWPLFSWQSTPPLSIGTGRNGIILRSGSNIVIRGFQFANFGGGQIWQRDTSMPIHAVNGAPGTRIENNVFQSIVNMNRQGAIRWNHGGELTVVRNTFRWSPHGSALVTARNRGPLIFACNFLSDVGRDGVFFNDQANGRILGNYMTRMNGLHGNAVAVYLDNRAIEIADNVIVDSARPIAAHGPKGTPYWEGRIEGDQSLLIQRNTLMGTAHNNGAFTSYGSNLRNVTLANNFLHHPRSAINLRGTERNVQSYGNTIIGSIVVHNKAQVIEDAGGNVQMSPFDNGAMLAERQAQMRPPPSHCHY